MHTLSLLPLPLNYLRVTEDTVQEWRGLTRLPVGIVSLPSRSSASLRVSICPWTWLWEVCPAVELALLLPTLQSYYMEGKALASFVEKPGGRFHIPILLWKCEDDLIWHVSRFLMLSLEFLTNEHIHFGRDILLQ